MDWSQIVLIVHVPMILLLLFGLKWLANKYGYTSLMSDPENQWQLIQKAVDQGIQYAEKRAGFRKKIDNPMNSKEKLDLALGLTNVLLKRFKLDSYAPAAEGLIEAALMRGLDQKYVPKEDTDTVVDTSPNTAPGLDALKLDDQKDG